MIIRFETKFWKGVVMHKKLFVVSLMLIILLSACRTYAPEDTVVNTPAPQAATMTFSENSTLFEIVPEESEARFLIDEVLRGEDKTVVGTTNQITGRYKRLTTLR